MVRCGKNRDAFCVVRVPTEAQEQERSVSRQRESLQQEKQRLAAQGRSHTLYYGHGLQPGEWSCTGTRFSGNNTQTLTEYATLSYNDTALTTTDGTHTSF